MTCLQEQSKHLQSAAVASVPGHHSRSSPPTESVATGALQPAVGDAAFPHLAAAKGPRFNVPKVNFLQGFQQLPHFSLAPLWAPSSWATMWDHCSKHSNPPLITSDPAGLPMDSNPVVATYSFVAGLPKFFVGWVLRTAQLATRHLSWVPLATWTLSWFSGTSGDAPLKGVNDRIYWAFGLVSCFCHIGCFFTYCIFYGPDSYRYSLCASPYCFLTTH